MLLHRPSKDGFTHLEGHLDKLSTEDKKTIAILEQMRIDEAQHSQEALESGAEDLPEGIKKLMSVIARVMTKSSYYI